MSTKHGRKYITKAILDRELDQALAAYATRVNRSKSAVIGLALKLLLYGTLDEWV